MRNKKSAKTPREQLGEFMSSHLEGLANVANELSETGTISDSTLRQVGEKMAKGRDAIREGRPLHVGRQRPSGESK